MSLNKVTVVCDIYDGAQNLLTKGTGVWNPSVAVTDATDHLLVAPGINVPASFHVSGSPQVTLIANDNGATSPMGWLWVFTPPPGIGLASSYTYDIAYANGATQYLSVLTPVANALPITITSLDGGSAATGAFPVGTVNGGSASG